MKIKLNSDFIDCYDHWFDPDGELVLNRRMDQGPNRIEMYKMLNAIGLKTPKFGMVADLYKDLAGQWGGKDAMKQAEYDKLIEMVVYTDISAHAGEGKIKCSLEEARDKYPGHFAAQHIPNTSKMYASRTERLLMIGCKQLWLEYISKDDWRSNCGDVQIVELGVGNVHDIAHLAINELQIPLYAIDFVIVGNERLAIDFNVSPGVKKTPAEGMMTGKEMAYAIKERMWDLYETRRF